MIATLYSRSRSFGHTASEMTPISHRRSFGGPLTRRVPIEAMLGEVAEHSSVVPAVLEALFRQPGRSRAHAAKYSESPPDACVQALVAHRAHIASRAGLG